MGVDSLSFQGCFSQKLWWNIYKTFETDFVKGVLEMTIPLNDWKRRKEGKKKKFLSVFSAFSPSSSWRIKKKKIEFRLIIINYL